MADAPAPRRGRRRTRAFELLSSEMTPVRRYKLLLQHFLERRSGGVQQTIADAIGKHPSFVSQMVSPAYEMPVPARYVQAIADHAGFTQPERDAFLDAYLQAHRDRTSEVLGLTDHNSDTWTLKLNLPALSSPAAQRLLEATITRMAREMVATALQIEAETMHAHTQTVTPTK